ncbi:hypothetical protein V8B55DRAFT_1584410 [Mucor lusitanicus]
MSSTSTNSNWNELPSDILQTIFEYTRSSVLQHPISTLKEATVVCKDWMKPAQQVLYRHVYLDADNVARFIYTIRGRYSVLAKCVKKATFFPGFETLKDTTPKLNTIVLLCQDLSEMHGANSTLQQLVWSYLKENYTFPLQLQSIIQHNQTKTEALGALYADVALKYKETMTQLQLAIRDSGSPLHNTHAELALMYKLPLFTSLKSLRVINFEENRLLDLNFLIDSCGGKVSHLCFDSLVMLPFTSNTPGLFIEPNTAIKNLTIDYADIPARCLDYLSVKLPSLDNLQIAANFDTLSFQDGVQWWTRLERLCLRPSKYSIHTNLITLTKAASLLQQSTSAKIKKLTIPNIIKIVSENMDVFYDKYMVRIPQLTPLSASTHAMGRYFTPEAVTYKIRRYLARECNDRNWYSFQMAIHMISLSRAFSTLHFDRMIFCDVPSPGYRIHRQELKLTHVYLTNSIIYYKMFYDLSERLSIIHHLTIDTCSILMEEQYSVRICLPFTKLTSLRYKAAPFLNATSFSTLSPNETSTFENDDLLNAVETNNGLIFKIETAQGIYTIRKKGDLYIPVGGTFRHLLSGTQSLFLVWIKCGDLDELIFDSNGKSSVVWKKKVC